MGSPEGCKAMVSKLRTPSISKANAFTCIKSSLKLLIKVWFVANLLNFIKNFYRKGDFYASLIII
jgi:hypothetical protein